VFPSAAWNRLRSLTDRGSMTVEMVVAVPAFFLLLLIIALGANWVTANEQVAGAARDAVRAASLARSGSQAVQAAVQAAGYDLRGLCTGAPMVNFSTTGGTSFANATEVVVKVTCQVNMKVFAVLGVGATQAFSSQSTAPLDPYAYRTS
jgi:Flp pilus assembly protein TadG